jgi:hypothetical protein
LTLRGEHGTAVTDLVVAWAHRSAGHYSLLCGSGTPFRNLTREDLDLLLS